MAEDRLKARSELLQEADRIVTQDRNKSYGEPDEDFQRIAAIADAMGFRVHVEGDVLRHLTGSDVARFMIALKLSRLAWMPGHRDSWLDIAGYAACGFETVSLEESRRSPQIDRVQPSRVTIAELTGHGYDGCPVCVRVRNENPEAII